MIVCPVRDMCPPSRSYLHPEQPKVLVLGGLDPSGAGLQADIETCLALGCHAMPIATAVTVQNTRGLANVVEIPADQVVTQIRHLVADVQAVAACKIGAVPSLEMAIALRDLLLNWENRPTVILDPVLGASAGGSLMTPDLVRVFSSVLLPLASLVKPNAIEAIEFAGEHEPLSAGARLSTLTIGGYALLTGTDTSCDAQVTHHLFRNGSLFAEFTWPRLSGSYHGTGCTLTSAIAALTARGYGMESAVARALAYTYQTVRAAHSVGGAQLIPSRLVNYPAYAR
ncbi:MAG: hydroxymethylpyrimidine/phosphomethylpyrimidine kinase [Gammaproteobacteria bacterium]